MLNPGSSTDVQSLPQIIENRPRTRGHRIADEVIPESLTRWGTPTGDLIDLSTPPSSSSLSCSSSP
eukprot:14294190-Heterocapsa_arctica.AAC.1